MSAWLATARAIHLGSLMIIFGGSAYAALLQQAGLGAPPAKRLRWLFGTAAVFALASGIAWFCMIAGQMSGSWKGALDPATLELTGSATRFGHIFLPRLIGLVALCAVCVVPRRRNGIALPILAGLLLVSLAPVSHAAASDNDSAILGAASDAAHVLAAGWWVGALAALTLMIAGRREDPAALSASLRLFSAWGSFVVGLLVLTGVANALMILPPAAMSLHNLYFTLLLVKVGAALLMMALAALNRWRLAPALQGRGTSSVLNLSRSVGVELVLGLVIVGIVGYLGTMAPH